MKKIVILLILSLFQSSFAIAINNEQAILVTRNFLQEKNISKNSPLSNISIQDIVKKDDIVMFYIMALGEREGFVIISASEYEPPIIGYSFHNEFQWQPTIQYYLDSYSDFILSKENSKNPPEPNVTKLWDYYLQENFVHKSLTVNTVPPLITSRWNQDKFYNTYCPWDRSAGAGYDYRVPNGCVALATAQIMNYYRHPKTGIKGASYKPGNYPTQSVVFSQHTYHWDAMCDKATNYTNEIAKLAHHLGVAVEMQYSPSGSGAFTKDVTAALNKHFDYTLGEQWPGLDKVKLKVDIDLLQPVLMSGNQGNSGHAFVVDGYVETEEDEIEFHFNWGWGGAADGYYTLRNQPFSDGAYSFLGIKPASNYPVQCEQHKRQTAFEGYVTNGSTNKPYESNPDCSWIIAAPDAKQYNFSFARLDTEEGVDVVTIYNGSSKSSEVAATFSGKTFPPQPISVTADSVLITFTSNNPTIKNTTHLGFLINYAASKPQQKCDAVQYPSEPSGYITDGFLPDENYTPWVACTWNLNQNNNTGFFGLFHEFDLNLGDFIDIYDATKSFPYFWKRYDRYSPPTVGEIISIPFSKIQIKFITDNFEAGKGFKFQYFSILGINDHSLLDNLNIFPNPATEVVNLSFSSTLANQSITCRIVDMMGKEVYSSNIEYYGEMYATQIPVAHLAKGCYFLQLVTTTGIATSKIMIN